MRPRSPSTIRERLKGIVTALVTPFRPNGALDIASLQQLLEAQVEARVNAISVCGSSGEGLALRRDEVERIIALAIDVSGQAPRGQRPLIIAGSAASSTAMAAELASIAATFGADAAMVVAPFYQRPTQAGLIAHFTTIADDEQIPIVVYNSPDRTGCNIDYASLTVIAEHPFVIGYKEASDDFAQSLRLTAEPPPRLRLLVGRDAFAAPLLLLGWDGAVSVGANVAPTLMTSLYSACVAGDIRTVRSLHHKLYQLVRASGPEVNPVPIKAALAMLGQTTDVVRPPLAQVGDETRANIRQALLGLVPKGALRPSQTRRGDATLPSG